MSTEIQPRGRGRHAGLTREHVLEQATALVDAHGLPALSMRRLGTELGVEAMALYHHVGNKEQLLDGLVEQLFLEAAPPELEGSWQEGMQQFARGAYDALIAHPHLVSLVLSRPATTPRVLRRLDNTVAALRDSGLPAPVALDLVYTIIGFVVGYVATGGSADEGDATRIERLAALDLTKHPALAEAVHDTSVTGRPSTFEVTLTAILTGFETSTSR